MKIKLSRIFFFTLTLLFGAYLVVYWLIKAPIFSQGELVPMTSQPSAAILEEHVLALTSLEKNRSVHHPEFLNKAALYIEESFTNLGYITRRQPLHLEGLDTFNIITEWRPGGASADAPWIVVGAHYDAAGTENPGADDNASGVAGLLELARLFKENQVQAKYPVQFVAYSTEEPPHFGRKTMGSAIHVQQMVYDKQKIRLMISIEMIGYFSDELFSQKFPLAFLYLLYPSRGNYIGIIGNMKNYKAVKELKESFYAVEGLATHSINAPTGLVGVDFSDHKNFWEQGWPAVMVTDTAFYRNLEYHRPGDTPDRLNYDKMALVVLGLYQALNNLR